MDYSFIKKICEKHGARYLENEPLAGHTSFKIGGACPLVAVPNGVSCLSELIREFNSRDVIYKVMGKGTNLLISGNGVNFPVILISSDMGKISASGVNLTAEAGASLGSLCVFAKDNSLSGLEFAYGIPGSVGGALYMNAGAYGGEIKDVVLSCDYIDKSGEIKTITANEMDLSYRSSVFTKNGGVIASVSFNLKKSDKSAISERMEEIMQKRRDKQPLEYPSAGSAFKRPDGDYAGRLIEASGLKGFSVGGAQVSEKHCGFIINRKNATFDDVKTLLEKVSEKVKTDSGRNLQREIIIWE